MRCLKNRHLFRLYEHIQVFINYSIPKEDSLYVNKVLAIAPHQDDEAVGCAGTLVKHVKSGGHLEIVFCTKDSQERMEESKKSAEIIGSKKNHYMHFPARSLNGNKDFRENLENVLNAVKPEAIFLPFFFDKHDDHIAISWALNKIKKKINLDFIVYAYSVWSPLNPNCLFDISKEWDIKRQAIECYKTQLVTRDYIKIAQGLNQYWGEVKERGMMYAEVFLKMTVQEYISFWNKVFK
ncbi:MAG: PIG-L family deacetylase [Endomicrobium sp.]|jgi:LmbE family N-acetylglucosaminyl deacetylase|nr:PIG-L family deacetylase [Endomicrobium sp.]